MKSKVVAIVSLIGSLYYMVAEFVCATFFHNSLYNTYVLHTISELGIPDGNSPLFWLMTSAFILIGLTLMFTMFYKFRYFITNMQEYPNFLSWG